MGKQNIRSKYLGYRDNLTKSERNEKSRLIWDRLKAKQCFMDAEIILVYMDYRSEVMTTGLVEELLLNADSKRVFAPRVEGMDISFYEIQSLAELESGYQGIREPLVCAEKRFTKELVCEKKCMVLVPGAVFDKNLSRMGYGKGFYDRFLQKYDKIVKAGLAYDCQIAGQIPVEEFDQRMDMIITEKQVIEKEQNR